jgi:hypothetical protein
MKRRRNSVIAFAAIVALGAALWLGRTRTAPDLTSPIQRIFPQAAAFVQHRGVFHVYDDQDRLVGWAASGSASGYGGPMLLVAGIDTLGRVAGVEVVEQRETPIFWRMVRASDYFKAIAGARFDGINYDYPNVVGVTGATISSDAVVASVRASVAEVAGEAFDVRVPLPRQAFEFGILEITILVVFLTGITVHRAGGRARRSIRWACQIAGLLILGFWKDSPITLAKITMLLSGYFPDVRTGLALYLLIGGFAVTTFIYGRNIYCLYACPFGAAQRCVGVIGGKSFGLPAWSVRLMQWLRNVIVFVAVFIALLTLQPALASYEPFAVLFSLRGTTLQWLLLFIVLVVSLTIRNPWCNFFCPMRSAELVLKEVRRAFRKGVKVRSG